ncbi:MAG: TonB-dependent receptor [Candidatus Kapaibacterium sp.]
MNFILIVKLDLTAQVTFPNFKLSKTTNGFLIGKLHDKNGIPAVGVLVQILSESISTFSNESGIFRFNEIKPGKYLISFDGQMYESDTEDSINIFAGEVTKYDLELKSYIPNSERIYISTQETITLNFAPNSVSIIDKNLIENFNINNSSSIFNKVSGISSFENGIGIRGSSGLSVIANDNSLFLIDGIPLQNPDYNFNISKIVPVNSLNKVEVLKNPCSGLYGNGASNGAVNFVTDNSNLKKMNFQIGFQNNISSLDNSVEFNRVNKNSMNYFGDFVLKTNAEKMDLLLGSNVKFGNIINSKSQLSSGNILIKTNYQIDNNTAMRFLGLTGYNIENNLIANLKIDSLNNDLEYSQKPFSNLGYMFNTNYESAFSENFNFIISAGILGGTTFNNNLDSIIVSYRTVSIASKFKSTISQYINFQYGSNLSSSRFIGKLFNNVLYRQISEISAGMNFLNNEDIVGNISARFELIHTPGIEHEYDLQISPNIGISYQPFDDTFLRASLTRGYKSPTMFELFSIGNNNGIINNPNYKLITQGVWHGEIGVRHYLKFNDLTFLTDGALFVNELFSLISPSYQILNDSLFSKYFNISRAKILGAELIFKVTPQNEKFFIDLGFITMTSKELKFNTPLTSRPEQIFIANFMYNFRYFKFGFNCKFSNKSSQPDHLFDLLNSNVSNRTGISNLDINSIIYLSNFVPIKAELLLNIQNVFDTKNIQDSGLLTNLRNIYIGFKYNFY